MLCPRPPQALPGPGNAKPVSPGAMFCSKLFLKLSGTHVMGLGHYCQDSFGTLSVVVC